MARRHDAGTISARAAGARAGESDVSSMPLVSIFFNRVLMGVGSVELGAGGGLVG